MIKKLENIFYDYFYLLILLIFISITGVTESLYINENKEIFKIIFKCFNFFRDNIHIITGTIFIILSIFIFLKGNKKNKIFLIITIFISTLSYINSVLIKDYYMFDLEIRKFLCFPLFFNFLNVFLILYKEKGIDYIEDLVYKIIKTITLYIGIIFALGLISGNHFISYVYPPYGYIGWFRETNAISHVIVIMLPIFMYFYNKQNKITNIFYILLLITCGLVIGTKTAYFGVYISLFLFLIIKLINYIKTKKIDIKKTIPIFLLTIFLITINKHLYAPQFMQFNYEAYLIDNELDTTNFLLKGRQWHVIKTWEFYIKETIFVKTFGMGLYYPRLPLMVTEMDFFDILFKQGIAGVTLYLITFIYFVKEVFKKIFKKLKKAEYLLFLLISVTLGTIASHLAGHVIFNEVSSSIYAMAIIFLYAKTKEITEESIWIY